MSRIFGDVTALLAQLFFSRARWSLFETPKPSKPRTPPRPCGVLASLAGCFELSQEHAGAVNQKYPETAAGVRQRANKPAGAAGVLHYESPPGLIRIASHQRACGMGRRHRGERYSRTMCNTCGQRRPLCPACPAGVYARKGAILSFVSAPVLLLCSFTPACTFLPAVPGVRLAACLGSAVYSMVRRNSGTVRLQYERDRKSVV